VITGVRSRDQDNTPLSRSTVQWVYDVTVELISLPDAVVGVYGADLGPDPRDALLAKRAFGPNLPKLARLNGNMTRTTFSRTLVRFQRS
jgi:hypothetical protein